MILMEKMHSIGAPELPQKYSVSMRFKFVIHIFIFEYTMGEHQHLAEEN